MALRAAIITVTVLMIMFVLFFTILACNELCTSPPPSYRSVYGDDVTCDEDIDIVVTWVDGTDDVRNALRERVKSEVSGTDSSYDNSFKPSRFQSFDDIKYMIRSVETYAPWIRHIIILASGDQVPPYKDEVANNPRVRIVYDDTIIDDKNLPTFNSHALEASMYRIHGLSERFLYACDDMFFGRAVRKEHFFPSDTPYNLYRYSGVYTCRSESERMHGRAWYNNNTALDTIKEERRRYPCHSITAMTKTDMARAAELFSDQWNATITHQFRHEDDIHPVGLSQYVAVYEGRAKWHSRLPVFTQVSDSRVANWFSLRIFNLVRSDLKCLNDRSSHSNPKVAEQVRDAYEWHYPPLQISET